TICRPSSRTGAEVGAAGGVHAGRETHVTPEGRPATRRRRRPAPGPLTAVGPTCTERFPLTTERFSVPLGYARSSPVPTTATVSQAMAGVYRGRHAGHDLRWLVVRRAEMAKRGGPC